MNVAAKKTNLNFLAPLVKSVLNAIVSIKNNVFIFVVILSFWPWVK